MANKEFEKSYFYHKEFAFKIIHQENELHHFFNSDYHFSKFQYMIEEIIDSFGLSSIINQSIIFDDMEFEVTKFMFLQGKEITIFIK
jgi:hypothetical protein